MPNVEPPSSSDNHRKQFSTFCQGQASLYGSREVALIDAVDRCQNHAVAYGYVRELGQDDVQRLMHEAFKPHRKDLPWSSS